LKSIQPVVHRVLFQSGLIVLTGLVLFTAGCAGSRDKNEATTQDSKTNYYSLAVSIVPASTGTVEMSPSGSSFIYGTRITLNPTASAGYEFCRWGISLSADTQINSGGVDSPLKIDMNSNKVVTAFFGISPAVAKSMLSSDAAIKLIDVRPKANYDQEHLPGAISIPFEYISTRASEIGSKDSRVIVSSDCYCPDDDEGALAAQILIQQGFVNTVELHGGLAGWVEADYSTVKGK